MSAPIATVGSNHVCPMSDGPKPHIGGPVLTGSPNVFAAGTQVCRSGDQAQCISPVPDVIAGGSPTVFANGQPVARQGDMTAHGGSIVQGVPTILVG